MKAEEIIEKHFKALTLEKRNKEVWEIAKYAAKQTIECIIKELESVEFNYDMEDRFKDVCLSQTVIPYYKRELDRIDFISYKDFCEK
jgi:hypothetical protein